MAGLIGLYDLLDCGESPDLHQGWVGSRPGRPLRHQFQAGDGAAFQAGDGAEGDNQEPNGREQQ